MVFDTLFHLLKRSCLLNTIFDPIGQALLKMHDPNLATAFLFEVLWLHGRPRSNYCSALNT